MASKCSSRNKLAWRNSAGKIVRGDGLGSKFDESGNMRDWQTSDDRKEFAEAASCQVAEYSKSRAVSDPDDLPVKGNGQLTLAENTADNGGLRIAFRALTDALVAQKKAANEDRWPSGSQHFFLVALLWCENQTSFSARQSDPHSLGRVRVNGAVQNFEEFGKAFACIKGQPMYPEKSRRVWQPCSPMESSLVEGDAFGVRVPSVACW